VWSRERAVGTLCERVHEFPMTTYSHRQFGSVIVIGLAGSALACLVAAAMLPSGGWIGVLMAAILGLCCVLFASLTIEVGHGLLHWSFGLGLISNTVPLEEICSAEAVRTRLWDGWGIHLTTRGWLYNVSGFDAVALSLKSGKRFVLGTDEPEELVAAIHEAAPDLAAH